MTVETVVAHVGPVAVVAVDAEWMPVPRTFRLDCAGCGMGTSPLADEAAARELAGEHVCNPDGFLVPVELNTSLFDSRCPHCTKASDAVTQMGGKAGAVPGPGAVMVCAYCAGVSLVAADGGHLRSVTPVERRTLLRDRRVAALVDATLERIRS